MTLSEQIITIGIAVLTVQFTRWLPFWIFPANRPIPEYIRYLGNVLPAAMFGMLVVYCYKNVDVFSGFHGRCVTFVEAQYVLIHRCRHDIIYVLGTTGICVKRR